MKGISAQRKIAVSRAIGEIASQLGVKVNTVTSSYQSKRSSSFKNYSIQTVEGKVVKAKIKEIWTDAQTGELYVWMVVE